MKTIRLIEDNGTTMYFICPSSSRGDLYHDIFLRKATGRVRCMCEDASTRKKRPFLADLIDGTATTADSCIHTRKLGKEIREGNAVYA